jgi:hypothetical protein
MEEECGDSCGISEKVETPQVATRKLGIARGKPLHETKITGLFVL